MIGKIKGKLDEVVDNYGLIETQSGLFYRVFLSDQILSQITTSQEVEFYTYHHIREDLQLLFGFQTKQEYSLFEHLLSVNGVGPKTAFHITSIAKPAEIITAVQQNDKDFFSRIKGLGKKTALKIILELSHKFHSEFSLEPEKAVSPENKTVIEALRSLGFQTKESYEVLKKLDDKDSVEDKIKKAIQQLTHS